MSSIHANLQDVRTRIAVAEKEANRIEGGVSLVAVSKFHPLATVQEGLTAGQKIYGENRVQEAAGKFSTLRKSYKEIELHLIGPLQTNKVRDAVQLFDVIETVDRPKLAESLAFSMLLTHTAIFSIGGVGEGILPIPDVGVNSPGVELSAGL